MHWTSTLPCRATDNNDYNQSSSVSESPATVLLMFRLFLTTYTHTYTYTYKCCNISVQSSGRTRSSSVVTLARPSVSSSLQITNRSVQSSGRTRSSSVVTLARPSVSSSLQITNRSFRYASPHLWNQLPSLFRQPCCVHSPPGSHHPSHITLSQSSPSFSPSITPSTFHSRLKSYLFHKSFPP